MLSPREQILCKPIRARFSTADIRILEQTWGVSVHLSGVAISAACECRKSFALHGWILTELALCRRITLVKDPNRRRVSLLESRKCDGLQQNGVGAAVFEVVQSIQLLRVREIDGKVQEH
jgi:hypothetical protein